MKLKLTGQVTPPLRPSPDLWGNGGAYTCVQGGETHVL